jgi:hypothetical protein
MSYIEDIIERLEERGASITKLASAWMAAVAVLELAERHAEETPCRYCRATPDQDGGVDHDDDCVGGLAHDVLMRHTLAAADAQADHAD